MAMRFEWDENKNATNKAGHDGLGFEDAHFVFEGDSLTLEDTRKHYGERRYITLGTLRGRLVVIAYTMRGEIVRPFSMRYAHAREKKRLEKRLAGR